jgi:hypothetical protein
VLWVEATGSPIELAIGQPSTIAFGDFNEDGNVDLVVSATQGVTSLLEENTSWTRNLVISFGDGTGSFNGPIFVVEEEEKSYIDFLWLLVEDVNSDGHLDLVLLDAKTVDLGGNGVTVLLGDGTGKFSHHQQIKVGSWPTNLVGCDFNADGYIDVAIADPHARAVYVAWGEDGGFLNKIPESILSREDLHPVKLATGELNGDGHMDLALAGFVGIGGDLYKRFVLILLGDGFGGFQEGDIIMFGSAGGAGGWANLSIVDYNQDGLLDLISSTKDAVVAFLNQPSGEIQEEVLLELDIEDSYAQIMPEHFNKDSCFDWLIVHTRSDRTEIEISTCNTSRHSVVTFVLNPTPVTAAIADVDNDGDSDIALLFNGTMLVGGEMKELTYVSILLNDL